MRMRLTCSLLVAAAAIAVPALPAQAALVPNLTVDGPNSDIEPGRGLDVALARDGDGGVAFIRREGGVPHVFVSRLVEGAFLPAERVDVGLAGPAQRVALAAGDGGRLLVVFSSGGGPAFDLWSAARPSTAATWAAPLPIVDSAATTAHDVALSQDGTGWAVFTTGTAGTADVRAARLTTAWAPVGGAFPNPPVLDFSDVAGIEAGTSAIAGEPRVAGGAGGSAWMTWGELDGAMVRHVYARGLSSAGASGATEVSVATFDGRPRASFADSPDLAVDDSGVAWFAWRETFTYGASDIPRALARRLSAGVFGDATAVDGLGTTPAEGAEFPRIAVEPAGKGLVVSARQLSFQSFSAAEESSLFGAAFRADATIGAGAPFPVAAMAGSGSGLLAWRQQNGAVDPVQIRGRERVGGQLGNETLLSDPALGSATGPVGGVTNTSLEAAADLAGNALVAFMQGSGTTIRVMAALRDEPPTAPKLTLPAGWLRAARPIIRWTAAADSWGAVGYRLVVDGQPVGETAGLELKLTTPLRDGRHKVQVFAIDGRGQEVASAEGILRTDVRAPAVRATVTGARKRGNLLRFKLLVDDAGGSGLKRGPLVLFGDAKQARGYRVGHRYTKAKRFTVKVTLRDVAGNARTYVIFVTVKRS